MNISNFSIKRPVFTLVTMFLVIILGIVSLVKIPLKLIPDINPPVAVVVATYQGASPIEVVEKVTKPLETSLSTLPGIKNVHSVSREGSNLILLEFSWTTSIDDIQNDILQRMDQVPLPADVEKPRLLKFDPSQFPVIQLSLHADENQVQGLQTLADQLVKELSRVEGVANVDVTGTLLDEINVVIDQDRLQRFGIAQSDIVNIIQANHIAMPGETVLTEGKELTTRIMSMIHSAEDIANLQVSTDLRTGEKVFIKDVARIVQQKQQADSITRTNEIPSVLLSVLQESDANTAEVSKGFTRELQHLLNQEQYKGIKADVLFDQGHYIQMAIGNIGQSLIMGGLLAMVVLFLFLRNVKSPLIIGIAIPYSVIVTFVLMYFASYDLNIMTLGGLALGIGMLVDNAIIVIENIYRHLSMGKDPKKAASEGAKEIAGAITASTLTTIAVFLPVVFISGLLGELFMEFAFTISFSLLASLFVALTVVPMLASRLLKLRSGDVEARRRRSKPLNTVDKVIRWSLQHRLIVLMIASALFAGSTYVLTTMGKQFLPPTDEGYFSIEVTLENGTALTETEKVVQLLEDEIAREEIVDVYVSMIGSTQNSFQRGARSNVAELFVKLKPLSDRKQSIFEFVNLLQTKVEKSVNEMNQNVELRFNVQAASGIAPQTVSFNVRDINHQRLEQNVNKIYEALKKLNHITELSISTEDVVEEVHISINREKAWEEGLLPAQIAMIINDVTRGVQATQIISNDQEVYSVQVAYDEAVTRDLEQLATVLIKKPDQTYIELGDIADIIIGEGPVQIQRMNQQEAVEFTLKYSTETNLTKISKEVDETIAALNLSNDTEISYSGEHELLTDSIDDMILAFVLAIVLIYIVMAAQFESFKYPFVIMFTVPLMIIGVAFALTATGMLLSIPAFIGLIILAGIVVNNAIVLVDYINQRKMAGLSTYESLVEAVKVRTRPILMTALTTILGLVPLAFGIGEGTEMNQPMGIAVIGGLISSTFLTLLVIPVVYSLFDGETRWMHRKSFLKKHS